MSSNKTNAPASGWSESIPIDDIPIDPDIPVVNTAKIHTKGNFTKKQMKLIFPADKNMTIYRIQYRMAGKKTWKSSLSAGTNIFIIRGLKSGKKYVGILTNVKAAKTK